MLMLQHCTVAGIGDALNISEPAVHALIGRITGRLEAASREAHQRQRATDDGQPAVVPCVPRWVH